MINVCGKVLMNVKLMPDENFKAEDILKELNNLTDERFKIVKTSIEPVAFGISAVRTVIIIEDPKVGSSIVEEELGKIKGVGSVNVEQVTLI